MIETNSPQSNSHGSESESGSRSEGIRERAERLREKVGDLSKTFDRIEETLADAGRESETSD
jgi:hypothetical protein